MAGSRENVETVRAFFQDMRSRGLDDPLLVVTDGAPGIIRAAEECFPRAARQRCLVHRMRNPVVKCFEDDFEACIAHLRSRSPTAGRSGPRMRSTSVLLRRAL